MCLCVTPEDCPWPVPQPLTLTQLADWMAPITRLVGDRLTAALLLGTVAGILGSGSLVCRQIAAFPPPLAPTTHAERRIRRMLTGETTHRSELDPERIFAALREIGLARLQDTDHLWLVLDGSDLRKPHAQGMEAFLIVPGAGLPLGAAVGWRLYQSPGTARR